MRDKHTEQLKHELHAAGATTSELGPLLTIASQLPQLEAAAFTPPRRANLKASRWQLLPYGVTIAISLVVGLSLLSLSQSSLPGSDLYTLKRASERVAVTVHPDYHENIMMRRAREVQLLTASKASQKLVMATLADYKASAVAYVALDARDKAAYTYCKDSLQMAENQTSGTTRQAIVATVAALPQTN